MVEESINPARLAKEDCLQFTISLSQEGSCVSTLLVVSFNLFNFQLFSPVDFLLQKMGSQVSLHHSFPYHVIFPVQLALPSRWIVSI